MSGSLIVNQRGEVRLAEDRGDDRRDDVGDERLDDRRERGADDDRHPRSTACRAGELLEVCRAVSALVAVFFVTSRGGSSAYGDRGGYDAAQRHGSGQLPIARPGVSVAQLGALGVESWLIARGWTAATCAGSPGCTRSAAPRAERRGRHERCGPVRRPRRDVEPRHRALVARPPRRPAVAVQVSTPRRCRSLDGVTVHGRRDCRREWHKACPRPPSSRALLDFAAVAPLERVRYALSVADYKKELDVSAPPGDRQ